MESNFERLTRHPKTFESDEHFLIEDLKKLNNQDVNHQIHDIIISISMFGESFYNWIDLYATVKNLCPNNYLLLKKFKKYLYDYALYEIQQTK